MNTGDGDRIHARQCWVLGIFDRSTKFTHPIVVSNNREGAVLLPLIIDHVFTNDNAEEDGEDLRTRVYTDGWRGYNQLEQNGYNHIVINHQRGFGQGINTTNHIESYWS